MSENIIQIGHNSDPTLSPLPLFTGARRSVENEIVNEEVEVHPVTSQPQDISRWVPGVNDGDPNAIVLYVSYSYIYIVCDVYCQYIASF